MLAGAALDVYEKEPEVHPDLLRLENVLLVPHLGSGTTETRTAMADLAVDNVVAVLSGRPPLTPVRLMASARSQPETSSAVDAALARAIDGLELPAVEKISESQEEDPFQVLIATLLSARTQDATTLAASTRLFEAARDAARDGRADRQADRAPDLSGQLLSAQGEARQSRRAGCSSSGSAAACRPRWRNC